MCLVCVCVPLSLPSSSSIDVHLLHRKDGRNDQTKEIQSRMAHTMVYHPVSGGRVGVVTVVAVCGGGELWCALL